MGGDETGVAEFGKKEEEVDKSGKDKDMGSPFREPTKEEEELFQALTDGLNERFLTLVKKHRNLKSKNLEEVATATGSKSTAAEIIERSPHLFMLHFPSRMSRARLLWPVEGNSKDELLPSPAGFPVSRKSPNFDIW